MLASKMRWEIQRTGSGKSQITHRTIGHNTSCGITACKKEVLILPKAQGCFYIQRMQTFMTRMN